MERLVIFIRAVTRRVSTWARGIGLIPPSALFGQNYPTNRSVVVNTEGNFQLVEGTGTPGEGGTPLELTKEFVTRVRMVEAGGVEPPVHKRERV